MLVPICADVVYECYLGQSWIIPEHFHESMVVTFGSGNHPLFDSLVKGADRR